MVIYAPGTGETDPKKVINSVQLIAGLLDTANTNIASNTSAITTLQTAGTGLTNVAGSLAVSLSKITASLGADVNLNNTANYFDGPSIAQGTSGTWYVSGKVTLTDTATAGFFAKLWDGTTVIDSGAVTLSTATGVATISLSGYLASPAANLRISVRDASTVNGKILFNSTGNSKDSTISAIRIA